MPIWEKYEPGDISAYVPMEKWGKDHWSTFAYLESCEVNAQGKIDNRRMRCNPRLHRELANLNRWGGLVDGKEYPTRLKDSELPNHDDWSCVEDMAAAGLVEVWFSETPLDSVFGFMEAKVKLTEFGISIAWQLLVHKNKGGNFKSFTPIIDLSVQAQ